MSVGVRCDVCGVSALPPCPVCGSEQGKQEPPVSHGPGSELAKIIPSIFKRKNCGCSDYAAKMDAWGVAGCIDRRDQIIQRLVTKSRLGELARPVAIRWLDRAIRLATATECGDPVESQWFTVLTTAPRQDPTLYQCVRSLRTAGFEPTVLAEPESLPTNCKTVSNAERLGVWRNWLSGCRMAIESGAKYILTVQDDIILHPDSLSVAEIALERSECGFVSLYTPRHYAIDRTDRTAKSAGLMKIRTKSLWGACAICWRPDELRRVIEHHRAASWKGARPRTARTRKAVYEKRLQNPYLIANSDTAIGIIMNDLELPMWFLNPSAARHVARYSAIGHGGNSGNRNCGNCANHEAALINQVFPSNP